MNFPQYKFICYFLIVPRMLFRRVAWLSSSAASSSLFYSSRILICSFSLTICLSCLSYASLLMLSIKTIPHCLYSSCVLKVILITSLFESNLSLISKYPFPGSILPFLTVVAFKSVINLALMSYLSFLYWKTDSLIWAYLGTQSVLRFIITSPSIYILWRGGCILEEAAESMFVVWRIFFIFNKLI